MYVILEQDVKIEGGDRIKQLCDVAQNGMFEFFLKIGTNKIVQA